MMPARFVIT